MGAVEDGLRTLAAEGTQESLLPRMQTRSRLYEHLGYADYAAFDSAVHDFTLPPAPDPKAGPHDHPRARHPPRPRRCRRRHHGDLHRHPETNSLTYRGYPVQDLAARRSFEEVAYLLRYGELPDAAQLTAFQARERALRPLDRTTLELLTRLPGTCHPMDVLRTAVSFFGAEDPTEDDGSPAAHHAKSLTLLARLPTVVAADQRRRRDLPPIPPDPALGYAENFFHMCFGSVPDPEVVRCFEISLILYAEHSFNASTFTARVVTSTLSDLYSAVTAAIGALKGPLHGGANEAVMHMLHEIGDPARAGAWLTEALAANGRSWASATASTGTATPAYRSCRRPWTGWSPARPPRRRPAWPPCTPPCARPCSPAGASTRTWTTPPDSPTT